MTNSMELKRCYDELDQLQQEVWDIKAKYSKKFNDDVQPIVARKREITNKISELKQSQRG